MDFSLLQMEAFDRSEDGLITPDRGDSWMAGVWKGFPAREHIQIGGCKSSLTRHEEAEGQGSPSRTI
ncbi:MAG TPA: hypothetical protein VMZ31_12050 [Phycisphaerae bacterium]|nr:hypothetical protein [Phycisphaerae bacterium]